MDLLPLPSFLKARKGEHNKPASSSEKLKSNPLTYPKSAKAFDLELFKKPTTEYRGCPLWSWNSKLKWEQLKQQIDNFQKMGLGGFYMHVRVGLDTEYMGDEFMDRVKDCVDYAESKGMMACLYDDDRWPSGVAGGKVTKQYPEHRGKHVLFTPFLYGTVPVLGGDRSPTSGRACRSENGTLLATYEVQLDENGHLNSARKLKPGEEGVNRWYAYLETNPGSPWFNGQTYVDTMSEAAIGKFIESTHEVYKAKIGDRFGTVVPSIFTDEPQFAILTQMSNPRAQEDIFIPWTSDIEDTFRKEYSTDLLEVLPQVVWDLPEGRPSLARYQFHDHVCERFVSAYMDQIAGWCKKNGIILNGHMMEEPTLQSQTTAVGEIMRCYRNMDMPGIDLLCDWIEYNTAKQCSSVARQSGVRGVMSEIYGVTHWWFTFEGHKGCGDWQAALGITFRVQHLTWLSMAGESKRDYPASIGYQSPWYQEYGQVEDHFARVGVAMTRGYAVTNIAVVHPIESYWLAFGPNGAGDEMNVRNNAFADLTNWLLHASLDFDFISESLLPNQVGKVGRDLQVGACKYQVVIVPNLRTIRSSTLKILRAFSKAGGVVIIAGSAPSLVDAQIPKSSATIEKSRSVLWSKQSILHPLEKYREIKITSEDGNLTERLLHQIRQDGEHRFVFICNEDRTNAIDTQISLKGTWEVSNLNTLTGDLSRLSSAKFEDGCTVLSYRFEGCASLLLKLSPVTSNTILPTQTRVSYTSTAPATLSLGKVYLSEPNVLLLDTAEYKYVRRSDSEAESTSEQWNAPTEVLRLENDVRTNLQMPLKGEAFKQPWAVTQEEREPIADLWYRFSFKCDLEVTTLLYLATEDPDQCEITINGIAINNSPVAWTTKYSMSKGGDQSWWVDQSIRTLAIPVHAVSEGNNILEIRRPFGLLTNIERVYILGEFGVEIVDEKPVVTTFDIEKMTWGDIKTQGLPFYVGNITYNSTVPVQASTTDKNHNTRRTIHLRAPTFSSPVLAIHDTETEEKLGRIAFQPHTLSFPYKAAQKKRTSSPETKSNKEISMQISITAFGNRYNSFGHVHLPFGKTEICGPSLFRTGGDMWTDGYALMEMGVLEPPTFSVEESVVGEEVGEFDWVVL